MDLGSRDGKEDEGPVVHSSRSTFSSSSKFNKCFLKNRAPSSSSRSPSILPISGRTSSHFVPSTGNGDPNNIPNAKRIVEEEEGDKSMWEGNENEEESTVSDHINIFLDPEDVDDEKVITLCGSIDQDVHSNGRAFLSYKSSLKIELITKSRKFGQIYDKRRGFKFNYEFIPEQVNLKESKVKELMSITSVTPVKADSTGHVTSLNFPFTPPKGVRHKLVLRGEIGSNLELRITKSMVHLLEAGSCDTSSDEQPGLTVSDYFGDIRYYPPIPAVWSVCLTNHSGNWYSDKSRVRKSIRGPFHKVNRIKSIQSNFHVISIESTSLSQIPFLFFFKSFKGQFSIPLVNHIIQLPSS